MGNKFLGGVSEAAVIPGVQLEIQYHPSDGLVVRTLEMLRRPAAMCALLRYPQKPQSSASVTPSRILFCVRTPPGSPVHRRVSTMAKQKRWLIATDQIKQNPDMASVSQRKHKSPSLDPERMPNEDQNQTCKHTHHHFFSSGPSERCQCM